MAHGYTGMCQIFADIYKNIPQTGKVFHIYVIANTVLLRSFDLYVFQTLHCDENSSMMQSNASTLYLFFIYFFNFIYFLI